jgi:hypothetical protein
MIPEKPVGEYAPSPGRAGASPQAQTVTRKTGRRACSEGETVSVTTDLSLMTGVRPCLD